MQVCEISRADITRATVIDTAPRALAPGEVRLAVERFALTANNVTYAATGEALGYWRFFPAGETGAGRLPVWGIGRVIESRGEIPQGERVFGLLPMAEEMITSPGRIRAHAWTDQTAHRRDLPPIYNEYFRLAALPGHAAALEDLMGLLYPLYATSFVLADWLADNAWFGAEQIVVGSASSKTAIGFMQLAAEMAGPDLVGLTSERNLDFVRGLGCGEVLTYPEVDALPQRPALYVDFSGNIAVRRAVHTRLGAQLLRSVAIGLSHWDKFEQSAEVPGCKPEFFFAPDQVKKRRAEWGPGVVEGRIMEAWRRLAAERTGWLSLTHHRGLAAAVQTYAHLAAGETRPAEGHVVTLD